MKVYVATSWKNPYYYDVLNTIKRGGHEVFDFRDENGAFSWAQTGSRDEPMTALRLTEVLKHPQSARGFERDKAGLDWCDACVLITPCGRSAHLELGYAKGQGKLALIYMPEPQGPDLMYKFASIITSNKQEILRALQ